MPYLIDGHNLIPKIPGLSLSDIDDEMQLVELLQEFCRLQRKQVEVHFDNAPPGQPRARVYGQVTARFTRAGKTADQAIQEHLRRLGKAARNWTVVSSDQSVQVSARAARAQSMSAEAFASLLLQTMESASQPGAADEETALSPDEVQDWLDLFGE